jgi:hypothetical protein
MTAKVPEPFEVLIIFAAKGDTLRQPLIPGSPPRDKDQLDQASALGCSALLKADAALEGLKAGAGEGTRGRRPFSQT